MTGLNILLQPDGSIQWLQLALWLIFLGVGYLMALSRSAKKMRNLTGTVAEWKRKYQHVENELKGQRSAQEAEQRRQQSALHEMEIRVKSLEGDIRALAAEKQGLLVLLQEKEAESKAQATQAVASDERARETKEKHEQERQMLKGEIQGLQDKLAESLAWEPRARTAEEEARKARKSLTDLERKSLEFDLRLKAASEYAARVQPLEQSLAALEEKLRMQDAQLSSQLAEKQELQTRLGEQESLVMSGQQNYRSLQEEMSGLQVDLAKWKNEAASAAGLEGRLESARQELEILRKENNDLQQEINHLKASAAGSGQPASAQPLRPEKRDDLLLEDRPGEGEES